MSLYNTFKSTTKLSLQKSLWKDNIHEVPQIQKIVVSMGIWSLATRKWMKDFSELQENLAIITGQAPHMIYSKTSVSNFKLREWMPVMLRVTLRGKKAYDMIERLVTYVFPRIRDFEWISYKKFDWRGNYSMGLKDYGIFPELNPESIKTPSWLQFTIGTSATNDADAKALLESLWVIFQKKQA